MLVLSLGMLALGPGSVWAGHGHGHGGGHGHAHVAVGVGFGGYWGYPYAYGWGYAYPYWGWGWAPYYAGGPAYPEAGSVKLDVRPKEARVFVDGYYVGTVEDSRRFDLPPGEHEVTLKLPGYKTHRFGIYAAPGHAVKLHQDLVKGEGEDAPDGLMPPPADKHAG